MRHVVVVNEAFAEKNFPGEDPLGKRVVINMKTTTSLARSSAWSATRST